VVRLEQRGAFRACRFYEKFARHRIVHGTPLQREPRRRVSAAPEPRHIARPLSWPARCRRLPGCWPLRMPMADTPGETDQNRGPRPA
jgi:hypothetical protein